MDEYKTVSLEASDEFTEKRSRFIGYVKPVTTEEYAAEFVSKIKSENWNAAHNVYAYVLREGQIRRFSDDGEPQGTAGIPVLDVILKEGLTDCAVVVTRYFGGILLGTGGLIRAYSHAAKIAVLSGKIVTMRLCLTAEVVCDYNFYGKLSSFIPAQGGKITDADFRENVAVDFIVPKSEYGRFSKNLTEISSGRYRAEIKDEKYFPFEI